MRVTCALTGCDSVVRSSGKFCSNACKQKAYRRRIHGISQHPDIQLYCGLSERDWNHHSAETGTHVCISPVNVRTRGGVKSGRETNLYVDTSKVTHILLDSGAFCDSIEIAQGEIVRDGRLSFPHALDRQIAHAFKYHYWRQVETIVSYDLLIDETWTDGERHKLRWSSEAAEYAVRETIEAAEYLVRQRRRIDRVFGHHVPLCLPAQGVDAHQYVRCTQGIVPLMEQGDIFGLGGWCISGKMRSSMLHAASEILPHTFRVLSTGGVTRVHVFGVILPALLGYLLYLCDSYGMSLSTDSAGPHVEPAAHGTWGYGSWYDPYYTIPPVLDTCRVVDSTGRKAPTCAIHGGCRGLERCRHVQLTRNYLANFREREPQLYGPLDKPYVIPL